MKKKYIIPNAKVVFIRNIQMMCTSGEFAKSGSNLNVTLGNTEGDFGDENTINSRDYNFWTDEY